MDSYQQTPRTTLKRLAKRGTYDKATVHAILDEAFICHVGCVIDGSPVVLPTLYGRAGETLYLHGAGSNRMLNAIANSATVSVAVTLVDALVMARSAFHHSMNFRSVVLFGTGRAVTDPAEKMEALRVISEQFAPGRWDEVRVPNENELKVTAVIAIPLEEVAAKVRTGPPVDDEADHALPIWAGVVPLSTVRGTPVDDGRLLPGVTLPPSIVNWKRSSDPAK
jgi:uncharacterized protein